MIIYSLNSLEGNFYLIMYSLNSLDGYRQFLFDLFNFHVLLELLVSSFNSPLPLSHLNVIVRIPVRVVDDHGVRRGQVDAEPAGPCGQQEHELLSAGRVEPVDGILAALARDRAVDALKPVAQEVHHVLEDVQLLKNVKIQILFI
jgi:hypothetical protein